MASNKLSIVCLAILLQVIKIHSHGNMVTPFTWHDSEGLGLSSPNPANQIGCNKVGNNPKTFCMNQWFTNNTKITGDQTIPDNLLYDTKNKDKKNPWLSPGSAFIYSPCGNAGGNPFGCSTDEQEFGECCGGNCGGYVFGQNAEELDYPAAKSTIWTRGTVQDVAWFVSANHYGGYSYRLCKMPEQGRDGLTEECFQKTPLDFHGDYQWIRHKNEPEFVQTEAVRTRIGTFPEGSQWTKIDLTGLSKDTELFHGWFLDQVLVPRDIDAGEYVLSFRWDCEKTSQIWNVCANIHVI